MGNDLLAGRTVVSLGPVAIDLLVSFFAAWLPKGPHPLDLPLDALHLCGVFEAGLVNQLANEDDALTRTEIGVAKHGKENQDVLSLRQESLNKAQVPEEVEKFREVFRPAPRFLGPMLQFCTYLHG